MSQSKILTIIYRIFILVLTLRWFVIGQSSMIFFAFANVLVLYFFFPSVQSRLQKQIKYFFFTWLHLSTDQYNILTKWIYYLFKHYIFTLSILYLLLVSVDYLFANILFLNMRRWLWGILLSTFVIREDIIRWEYRLWDRELKKSDWVFLLCIIIAICLLINFQPLWFYKSYFYSISIARLFRIFIMLILGFSWWKNIFKKDIFWLWWWLALIFFFIRLRNIFPQIKQSLTHEKIITQSWYIYINCPADYAPDLK